MNEKNTDQKQKPRTSKLAIASFVCILIFLGIGFPETFLGQFSGNLDLPVWFIKIIFMVMVGTFFGALILGMTALRRIKRSGGLLTGKGFAIPSIAIPLFLVIIFVFIMPQCGKVRPLSVQLVCGTNVKGLGTAIFFYSHDNDGYLPTAEIWCDLIIGKEDVRGKTFVCPSSEAIEGKSSYAFNKNVAGMKRDEIRQDQDVVLLFETKPGWNQICGPEILTVENHNGKGCNVGFADGHSEFVRIEDLDTLRWEP